MAIRTIHDYIDKVHEKFPEISRSDTEKILKHAWKSIYKHNSYGGDVAISSQIFRFWLYMGKLSFNGLWYFMYHKRKLKIRIRVLYRRKKIEWDNYYYFALSDKQMKEMILNKKNPSSRKVFRLINVIYYKIFEECLISQYGKHNIFRIRYAVDMGTTVFKRDYEARDIEYIYRRVGPDLIPIDESFKPCHNSLLPSNYKYLTWKPTNYKTYDSANNEYIPRRFINGSQSYGYAKRLSDKRSKCNIDNI